MGQEGIDYPKYRKCAVCRKSDPVYLDDEGTVVFLFQYSTRHYAHAGCLAMRDGTKAAMARIYDCNKAQFRAALRDCDDWTRAAISVRNRRIRDAAQHPHNGGNRS